MANVFVTDLPAASLPLADTNLFITATNTGVMNKMTLPGLRGSINGTTSLQTSAKKVNDAINEIHGRVGSTTLSTTKKNVTEAINEIHGRVGSATLTTTSKNLTGAVNELKSALGSGEFSTTAKTVIGAINELDTTLDEAVKKLNSVDTITSSKPNGAFTYDSSATDSDTVSSIKYMSYVKVRNGQVIVQINAQKTDSGAYFHADKSLIGTIDEKYRPDEVIRVSATCGATTWGVKEIGIIVIYPNGSVYGVCSNSTSENTSKHIRGYVTYPLVTN